MFPQGNTPILKVLPSFSRATQGPSSKPSHSRMPVQRLGWGIEDQKKQCGASFDAALSLVLKMTHEISRIFMWKRSRKPPV